MNVIFFYFINPINTNLDIKNYQRFLNPGSEIIIRHFLPSQTLPNRFQSKCGQKSSKPKYG